ncbi:TonB-dependent receptor [Sphingomonas psychrotolerans]|uniref:TonB-dependent receptor n=1 Tax=Sphingomonas psychrotolerans TaxID=1327635 RepID=A0ABU3N3T3_9SPHN|nr:TonB-dependent receptor [Sphingomonas psychrotolerans]MDT8759184.1 TonB-dependent receptor [Sphingomonas psychrotolerans]
MLSRSTLATLAASSCLFVVPIAQAQARFSFDMPAQPLETALRSVATRTSTNIIFDGSALRGRVAPPLHGEFNARDAFHTLLQGSGLALNVTQGGSFIVVAPARQSTTRSENGSISGHLTRDEGGRALAGALVRVVETGQTTTADDNGDFRFASIPAGQYTLEISFLGFETRSQQIEVGPGNDAAIALALNEGVEEGEQIVVYGTRSARANALNLQRSAENNTEVVSADDLGNFTGTTFSDALRRTSGVSFQRDSITGDGTNVIVRGLDPDMNNVKLNGLQLPVGNGTGRSADLSNLLADSVGKITISKSLLPSQDSAGTGGLIEIETLSPLNRPRRYASFQVEGGLSGNDFSKDFLVSGTVAGRFGAQDNFGLSASVQYRRNSVRNVSYNTVTKFGAFLPNAADGTPTLTAGDAVDPNAMFPFVDGDDGAYVTQLFANFNHVKQSTLAATLSAEWQIGTHTNWKFDFQHAQSDRTGYAMTDSFTALSKYSDVPGGAAVSALHLDLSPGNAAIQREQAYAYDPGAKTTTDTYSFSGKSSAGKLTFTYLAGYAHGSEDHDRNTTLDLRIPDTDATPALFLPEAVDPELGYIITPFGRRSGDAIPIPLLSAAGWALINDPSRYTITNGTGGIDTTTGSNNRYTGDVSLRWDMDWGFLKYVQIGARYERTEFRHDLRRTQFGGNASIASLGLPFSPTDLTRVGVTGANFTAMSEGTAIGFFDNMADYLAKYPQFTLAPIAPAIGQDEQNTREDNYAAYVQSRLEFGKLEIIGGVRYNRTDLSATNLVFPTYIGPILPANGGGFGSDIVFQNQFSRLVTETAHSEDFLPRVLFNFRQSDNLIFRGGYFLSIARPQIGDLSQQTRISFINIPIPGPEGVKPILQINSGNPNLKQATTHNFDLNVEYYDKIGIIKFGGFYKRIENLLQANQTNGPANLANVTLPASPYFQGAPYFDPAHPENYFINGGSPINSTHPAIIWGIEARYERQFDFLPGALSGLGVIANYTFTKSSRWQQYSWAYAPAGQNNIYEFSGLPFNQQPKHSGTVALTYQKYGFDGTLAYSFQSRTLDNFYPRGLSVYNQDVQTLDLRGEYYIDRGRKYRIYVEAADLLKGTTTPDVQQLIAGYYTRATYLGGRKFKIGAAAIF